MKKFEFDNPKFYKDTGRLMVPVMLQSMISMGVNFLDNIMIGGFGENAISAASFSNMFYVVFQFMLMGMGSGAVVLSSQFWGRKDIKSLRATSSIGLQITLVICLIFTVITILLPGGILRLFTNQQPVVEAGVPYLRLLGTTFLFAGLSSTSTSILRSTGQVKVPLVASIIAFFVNIFFNWMFIFGKLGAPALGLTGAAVGTVIARTAEFVIVFGYFLFVEKNIGFRLRNFLSRGEGLWGQYIKFAIPVIISDTLLGVSLAITSAITGHVSAEMSAASSVITSLVNILSMINSSIGGAAAVLIGNSIGAGELDYARRIANSYMLGSVILGAIAIPILILIEGPYMSLYTVSEETLAIAHKMMICNCLFLPIQTMAFTVSKGVLRGGGDTRFLLFADSSMVWFVSIPLGALAGLVWHMDAFWIYFFLRVEFPLKGLLCLMRYLSGKWIKEIKR